MNQKKLKSILKAITPDETAADFSALDAQIDALKKGLAEKINIKTVEDVSIQLEKFKKRIDFAPLLQAIDGIRNNASLQSENLSKQLEAKGAELEQLIKEGSESEHIQSLQLELEGLRSMFSLSQVSQAADIASLTTQIAELGKLEGKVARAIKKVQENITAVSVSGETDKKEARQAFKEGEEKIESVRQDILRRLSAFDRGGSMNQKISVNGTVMSTKFADINLIGSITAADNRTTGQVDITFSGSGGSYSILTATGTIDDSNTAFVFTKLPTELVVNGASYIQTGGAITWTWNAGTLTATLSSPVGTGGSIYGRV